MRISQTSWRRYIDKLSAINSKASELMINWMSAHEGASADDLIEYAYAIATKYGEAAAALACQMYDATALASGKTLPPAEPASTATYKETAIAVNGAKLQGEAVVPHAVERLVKLAGQDTTVQNAIRDGAYWAWVPAGDTCSFCITLASRGFQKASKKMLRGGHAEHIHAHCDCAFTVRFDADSVVEGYDPNEYLEKYQNAGGDINAMRRENYAKNKDKINLQKREAYARRKQLEAEKE